MNRLFRKMSFIRAAEIRCVRARYSEMTAKYPLPLSHFYILGISGLTRGGLEPVMQVSRFGVATEKRLCQIDFSLRTRVFLGVLG